MAKNATVDVVLKNIPDFANDVPLHQMKLNKNCFINVLSIKRGNRIIDVNKDTMFSPYANIKRLFNNVAKKYTQRINTRVFYYETKT